MKLFTNFLQVACPHCSQLLRLSERTGLIWHCYDQCRYCQQYFQVKRRRILTNAAVIGWMIGLLSHIILQIEIWQSALLSVILVVVFQRFVDLLYSLEPVNDDSFI